MKREIPFSNDVWSLKDILTMLAGFITLTVVLNFIFDTYTSIESLVITSVIMIAVYSISARFRKSHLSVSDGQVYLYQLPATLKYKSSIFGKPYIQITSLTESGYHRLNIKQHEITPKDWTFLFNQCSSNLPK